MLDNSAVAPVRGVPAGRRSWEGTLPRRPWEWPVTAAVVHRDTPEMLAGVVSLLRAQRVRPYLLVVDTGSGPEAQATLEELHSCDDCEVHYLRSKGWLSSSAPVAAAMDVAFAVCQSTYLFSTHTDVFPTSDDLVGHLLSLCDARTPVVGWQMSRREKWPAECWKSTPSHTATMYHMPTMRSLPASWSLLGAQEAAGLPTAQTTGGYPDTETRLGQLLAAAGYTPRKVEQPDDGKKHILFLGGEPNQPYTTPWFRHVRTVGSLITYFPDDAITAMRLMLVQDELDAIPARLAEWSKARVADD